MDIFSYVLLLVSIIVGLSIARLLDGVGGFIGGTESPRAYWLHLLWVLYTFIYIILFWWWEFRLGSVPTWTFELYLFFILYAVLLYLLCVILFPNEAPDFFQHHFTSRKWFFGVWICVMLIDVVDTRLKGSDYLASLGLEYWLYISLHIVSFTAMLRSTSERLHATVSIIVFVYQLVWAFRHYETVS